MMAEFQRRSLANAATLGERLQAVRLSRHSSLERIAADLQIRLEYLQAIEQSNYRLLPSSVFVRNYVRRYAKYLRIEAVTIEPLLKAELEVYEQRQIEIPTLKKHLMKRPLKVANVVIGLVVVFLALGVIIYFLFQVNNIIQPPPLTLEAVPSKVSSTERFATINGQTVPEATVLINDQPIIVREDGSFSQVMTLQPGINIFKISVKTKRSREQVHYQQIIVEELIK